MAAALSTDIPTTATMMTTTTTAYAHAAAAAGGGGYDINPWHPTGVLVAQLMEHTQCVNQLAVAGNGGFVASASDDGTVKVCVFFGGGGVCVWGGVLRMIGLSWCVCVCVCVWCTLECPL